MLFYVALAVVCAVAFGQDAVAFRSTANDEEDVPIKTSDETAKRAGEDNFRTPEKSDEPVLVLGGQGLAGSATLLALLEAGYKVSTVNDNKDYYDYSSLFEDRVESVACVRTAGLDGCFELQNFLKSNKKVRAIVDFTSSTQAMMTEAVRLLAPLEPDVYMFVSAAAVYDVTRDVEQPLLEKDAVRPEDESKRALYSDSNEFGENMLSAEEVLTGSGLPYVILRCGDLIGPRDTTYRWWQYQVWSEHFDIIDAAFPISNDLQSLPFSLTYGDDVAQAIVSVLSKSVSNEVYNVAMDKSFTLSHLLLELCTFFNNHNKCFADFTDEASPYSLYPSNHQGVLSIEKAKVELGFEPTSWEVVLKETIAFYEGARSRFTAERDIILTRLNKNAIPYLKMDSLNEAVMRVAETVSIVNKQDILKSEL